MYNILSQFLMQKVIQEAETDQLSSFVCKELYHTY